MIDPTALIFASQEARRLSESARPGAPTVAPDAARRRPRLGPAAGALLRRLADRIDGGRAQRVPSRADAA